MGQPTWRDVKTVSVPERTGAIWTPVLDYLTPGRLYRLKVEPRPPAPQQAAPVGGEQGGPGQPGAQQPAPVEQTWTPESAPAPCTADGDTSGLARKDPVALSDVRVGALIARIGGSTADHTGDKEKTVVFAVGRHCVFQAPEAPRVGSLYLSINDTTSSAARIDGQLEVKISEAL